MRPLSVAQKSFVNQPRRFFNADVVATETPEQSQDRTVSEFNERVGADQTFNENKHSYVLTFPWNFEEVLDDYAKHRPMSESSYWHRWMTNSRAVVDFNNLFREFHQACAIPDQQGLDKVCEPRLASYVGDSIRRIHFHGLDVEMANLTVEQPSIKILKAEVSQGLNVDRSLNSRNASDYNINRNHNIFGAKWSTYSPKNTSNDDRHVLDVLDTENHRPYLVSLTCLVESPMKLYVLN